MFGILDDLFTLDEIDLNAMFMANLEEDELQDFDEYWNENFGKVTDNERCKCII